MNTRRMPALAHYYSLIKVCFGKHALPISCGILVFGFLLSRLPFFLFYPVPLIAPDTTGYLLPLEQVDQDRLPTFELRTPGYPLFLYLTRIVSAESLAIIVAQHVLSISAALFLVYAIHRTYRHLTLLIALGLTGYVSYSFHLFNDSMILSESLYATFLILFCSLFILAMHSTRPFLWAGCSLAMASIVLLRPTGLFLFVTLACMVLFVWPNPYPRAILASLIVPFAVILLTLCIYNYRTIGSFAVSTAKESSLIWGISVFVDPDTQFPKSVNEAIEKKQAMISERDRDIIRRSWDPFVYMPIYHKHILRPLHFSLGIDSTGSRYLENRDLIGDIIHTGIRQHPYLFLKYYLTSFAGFFYSIKSPGTSDFYGELLPRTYQFMFVKGYEDGGLVSQTPIIRKFYKADVPERMFVTQQRGGELHTEIKPVVLERCYYWYGRMLKLIFRNIAWPLLFLAVTILSVKRILRTGHHSRETFIVFILATAALGHLLLSALGLHVDYRYSFPVEFMYYMVPALYWGTVGPGSKPSGRVMHSDGAS